MNLESEKNYAGNRMMSLDVYVGTLDDEDIILYLSKYRSMTKWQKSDVSNESADKMKKEWKRRHGIKPIPRVLTDIDMVVA